MTLAFFAFSTVSSGKEIEKNNSYTSTVKSDPVSWYEFSVQQSSHFKEDTLISFEPDWIVFIDSKSVEDGNKNSTNATRAKGLWFGRPLNYTRDFDHGTIDWIKPNPKEQTIILLIIVNKGLPRELKKGRAYFWKGGKELFYIRKFDKTQTQEELKKQFGLNYFSIGLSRMVSLEPIKN